eukprot:256884_1
MDHVVAVMRAVIVKMRSKHIYKLTKMGYFSWSLQNRNMVNMRLHQLQLRHSNYNEIFRDLIFALDEIEWLYNYKIFRFFKSKYFKRLRDDINHQRILDKLLKKHSNDFITKEMEVAKESIYINKVEWIHCNYSKCNNRYLIPNKDKIKWSCRLTDETMFNQHPNSMRKFKLCNGCNLVYYCSRKCQKK